MDVSTLKNFIMLGLVHTNKLDETLLKWQRQCYTGPETN